MKKTSQVLWFIVLFSGLLSSLTAGWYIQAAQDYNYDFWYDWYDIGAHINKYAPQNRYIHGLQNLSKEEYSSLFSQIVKAVHHRGEGLADITFKTVSGQTNHLLREAEIQHLKDVAALMETVGFIGMVATVITILFGRGLMRRRILPKWKIQALCLSFLVVVIAVLLLIVGPKKIFYVLHMWIFPPDHEWFFYYQDSLMSTVMKAPDIFGGIAVAIVLSGAALYAILIAALLFWQNKQRAGA